MKKKNTLNLAIAKLSKTEESIKGKIIKALEKCKCKNTIVAVTIHGFCWSETTYVGNAAISMPCDYIREHSIQESMMVLSEISKSGEGFLDGRSESIKNASFSTKITSKISMILES